MALFRCQNADMSTIPTADGDVLDDTNHVSTLKAD
jgi:hypothetical protein